MMMSMRMPAPWWVPTLLAVLLPPAPARACTYSNQCGATSAGPRYCHYWGGGGAESYCQPCSTAQCPGDACNASPEYSGDSANHNIDGAYVPLACRPPTQPPTPTPPPTRRPTRPPTLPLTEQPSTAEERNCGGDTSGCSDAAACCWYACTSADGVGASFNSWSAGPAWPGDAPHATGDWAPGGVFGALRADWPNSAPAEYGTACSSFRGGNCYCWNTRAALTTTLPATLPSCPADPREYSGATRTEWNPGHVQGYPTTIDTNAEFVFPGCNDGVVGHNCSDHPELVGKHYVCSGRVGGAWGVGHSGAGGSDVGSHPVGCCADGPLAATVENGFFPSISPGVLYGYYFDCAECMPESQTASPISSPPSTSAPITAPPATTSPATASPTTPTPSASPNDAPTTPTAPEPTSLPSPPPSPRTGSIDSDSDTGNHTPSTNSSSSNDDSGGLPFWALIVIVVLAVVVIGMVLVAVVRSKRGASRSAPADINAQRVTGLINNPTYGGGGSGGGAGPAPASFSLYATPGEPGTETADSDGRYATRVGPGGQPGGGGGGYSETIAVHEGGQYAMLGKGQQRSASRAAAAPDNGVGTYSRLGARSGDVVYDTAPQVAAAARPGLSANPAVPALYATVNRRSTAESSSSA